MLVGSHFSDSFVKQEEDDDNRNHAHPDQMTLRFFFSLMCLDVALCVTSSLSFSDTTPVAVFDNESAGTSHSDETNADVALCDVSFGAWGKAQRVRPHQSVPATSRRQNRTLPAQGPTGIRLDKNLENDEPARLHFEESARAWEGLDKQDTREDTSSSESRRRSSSESKSLVGASRRRGSSSWASQIQKMPISRKSSAWLRSPRPMSIMFRSCKSLSTSQRSLLWQTSTPQSLTSR